MNLREAILAGAEKVDRRIRGTVLSRASDGEGNVTYAACALGAAYLGCHPDVDMETASRGRIDVWVNEMTERVGRAHSTADRHANVFGRVTRINDMWLSPDAGWEELVEVLHGADLLPDGTRLDEIEVCDEAA